MWHPIKHYKTIHHHKMLVMQNCFRCGLYWQGLTHDLSKLSPVEFWAGAKYWQGICSPNNAQRQKEGYSAAWLHHKGRNKHHLEYWIDYAPGGDHAMAGMRMPEKYVAEMVCDRIAASKNYKGKNYTDAAAWEYYDHSKDHYILHPETRKQLETCLLILRDEGEDYAKKLKRAGNLVEHHRIKGALHGYFALGIEHLYVQESFQYMNAFLRKEKQQKNADEELENIAAVKKQLTHGKA